MEEESAFGGDSSLRPGTQYTALSFGERLKEAGIFPSMGRAGSALDNAMAESFVSTLKAEWALVHSTPGRRRGRPSSTT